MTTAAVSGMLLVTNRNALQEHHVDSLLTEKASGVLHELSNLRDPGVVIEKGTRLPSASLPNLTELTIRCDNEDEWPQLFHGATFGNLRSITFLLVLKKLVISSGCSEGLLSLRPSKIRSQSSVSPHHAYGP